MKYYVVADVHSYYDELITALKNNGFFEEKAPYKLIVCGDVLDRGPKPKEITAFLIDLLKQEKLILIKGNHEYLLDHLLDNLDLCVTNRKAVSHHYHNGTVDTVLTMTNSTEIDLTVNPTRIVNAFKNTDFYKILLPSAIDYFETDNYVFVHGYIPCKTERTIWGINPKRYNPNWRNATREEWYEASWINGMQAWANGIKEDKKTIVCGHYKTSFGHANYEGRGSVDGEKQIFEPFIKDGIMAIDGTTKLSGIVNCIVLED